MKITSSTMQSTSSMAYERTEAFYESVRIQNTAIQRPQGTPPVNSKSQNSEEEVLDPKLRSIVAILERLIGKKITVSSFRAQESGSLQFSGADRSASARVGWGMEISRSYSLHEEQSLSMSFSGQIETEEGKKMEFSLNLRFSREFNLTQSAAFRAGDALSDPLVISLDGTSPIGNGKFAFDLIEGGGAENIPFLSGESGFLTLDKNGDGKVTDGGELFGPRSGDGFAELAQLDEDKNGWIDDNDTQFKALKLWIKTGESDRIVTLKEAGIGALSLQAIRGEFDFKDSSNTTLARLQNTSVALSESGEAKALFGLDVAV